MIEALRAGMTARTICLCIDAAQEAERPSWAYAAAVLRNCLVDGALTPEAFEARQARHRAPSDGFSQRQYSEADIAELARRCDQVLFDL